MSIDPDRVKEIFLGATEQPDEAARVAYLDRACGGDAGLRDRVEALLRSHESADSFLGTPAAALPRPDHDETIALDPCTPGPGHQADWQPFLSPSRRPNSLGRLGHYEVLEVLGRGGFGIVFRAFDEALQRVVAIKALAPDMAATSPARKRFLREASASARVRHENVVQVYAVEEGPLPYLVMELVPGETLQQRLDRTGPLDAEEVVRIGRQTAEGLAAAHATGLIHRDIKPANILIEAGPRQHVKITDFGLARAADDASMTQSGVIAGTPMYMAPEQAQCDALDHRADLFSLGSVLYTMCSGRPPFRASSTLAVLRRVAEDTPRPIREIIPEVPRWLCDLITRLHAKRPEDRFQTAREVADLLGRGLAGMQRAGNRPVARTPVGEAPEPAPPNRPPSRAGRWAAAAAVLLLLLGGLGITEATGVTRVQGTIIRLFSRGAVRKEQAPPLVQDKLPPTFTNGIGMELVIVPKGKSWLGGGKGKPGDREVVVPADFYLGKYQVTQEEWEKVMGENPSRFSRTGGDQEAVKDVSDADLKRFPVENVTWAQCQDFVAKLNRLEKETGWAYRLPTSAEWEYACRGGACSREESAFNFYLDQPTNDLSSEQANFNGSYPAGKAAKGKYLGRTCKVGSYRPNRLGLYDMHGNVWQWCEDAYAGGPDRLIRGGGALGVGDDCWAGEGRRRAAPSERNGNLGLRLARAPLPAANTLSSDPDRRAAEYVLSIGGAVKVNGQDQKIQAAPDLPREPFQLSAFYLDSNNEVTDAGLANFKDCKNLAYLNLWNTRVSDAGLAHFKDCKDLTYLGLEHTQVGNAGLAHFKDCKKLEHLGVDGNKEVSDAGLAHFQNCKDLTHLGLARTQVSDKGLAPFKDCKNLVHLWLGDTQVSDAGLASFKGCKALTWVHLDGTRVSDAGLAIFKDHKSLTTLLLHNNVQISDAGLSHIKGCENLTELFLQNTKVTAKGIDELKKALPQCKITWDGGVIDPTAIAWERSVAAMTAKEQVKAVIARLKELNPGFDAEVTHEIEDGVVTELRFSTTENLSTLSPVRALVGLKVLHGHGGPLSDLSPLKGMPLEELTIARTRVSDLSPLKGMKLRYLNCDGSKVSDLSPLKGMPLTDLGIHHTEVSDLSPLKDMPLKNLPLHNTRVTDLKPLKGMSLELISLTPKNITRGMGILRDMKSLKTIQANDQALPAAEFWDRYDKGELKE